MEKIGKSWKKLENHGKIMRNHTWRFSSPGTLSN
jgi:hypothetical protein